MGRVISIGTQDFGEIIRKNCFFVDKTSLIKEWWESEDSVTLITRPRRFGKTLNMSMLDYFFSVRHAADGELFEGLGIWKEERYQRMQGTYPVISLTFADIKQQTFKGMYERMCAKLYRMFEQCSYILEGEKLSEEQKNDYIELRKCLQTEHRQRTTGARSEVEAALQSLSYFMSEYYGQKVLIFLDEYDTPMQEAYVSGYWDEMAAFIRSMFNAAFKTNPYMERALITGITRVMASRLRGKGAD